MKVRCGYACVNQTLGNGFKNFRKATLDNEDYDKIDSTILYNFQNLLDIVEWNIENNFYVFRISSNIVPFLSDERMLRYIESTDLYNRLGISSILSKLRSYVEAIGIRLSIHLIEYTHINSNSEETMYRGYSELLSQYDILKKIGGDTIVFHGGGLYDSNPETMLSRLEERLKPLRKYMDLSTLAIENDDRTYTADLVKDFAKGVGIGWCYDYHHDRCNPCDKNAISILGDYNPTKYHISTGLKGELDRAHADYVDFKDIKNLCTLISSAGIHEADIMFEAKQKELSVLETMRPVGKGYWEIF